MRGCPRLVLAHNLSMYISTQFSAASFVFILALQKAAAMSWKQAVRILVHIGDAPPHGREYTNMWVLLRFTCHFLSTTYEQNTIPDTSAMS